MFMCNLPSAEHMDQPLVKLNGINEGVQVMVQTKLEGADDPNKVADAMHTLFPEFPLPEDAAHPEFGSANHSTWSADDVPLGCFLTMLHTQRILDTALDAMGRLLEGDSTTFSLSRQAALANKVAFPLPDESPLGGVIEVRLVSPNLLDWLHAATWHKGRDRVPRTLDDERAMAKDGDASTWV
jgi:predicted RNA binding protein with dsRBD fold (UPF0201 family)